MVDIEFLTQMLQLRHGYRYRAVRRRGTLEALDALKAHHILRESDHRLLKNGYLFLRRLDHRLRLDRDQSMDVLEREPEKLEAIARGLGYKSRDRVKAGSHLLQDYERWRERIRRCYEWFLTVERQSDSPFQDDHSDGFPV
jgi:glutamate-ammonia-ligase adenylyltransferase